MTLRHNLSASTPRRWKAGDQSSETRDTGCDGSVEVGHLSFLDHAQKAMKQKGATRGGDGPLRIKGLSQLRWQSSIAENIQSGGKIATNTMTAAMGWHGSDRPRHVFDLYR